MRNKPVESTEDHIDHCIVIPPPQSIHPDMSGNWSNSSSATAISIVSHPCTILYLCFFTATVLLLPLFALVLYIGHHQWRGTGSVGMAAISHSDVLTYNIIPVELFSIFGHMCNLGLIFTNVKMFVQLAFIFVTIGTNGTTTIHLLTCVEHYVAVCHPVQYLKSKKPRNIRIRNISIVCYWLLSVSGSSMAVQYLNIGQPQIFIMGIFTLSLQFLCVVYCNILILCSLRRPGPGAAHRNTVTVNVKKRRAFYTVTAIMAVLLLRFLGAIVQLVCLLWLMNNCFIQMFCLLFNLPSSLVQPLLFLHRAGKLLFCKTQRSKCST